MSRWIPATLGAALSLVLVGCGGGSGGGQSAAPPAPPPPPPPPPSAPEFGLTSRVPLAPLTLPLRAGELGALDLQRRFPNLSFPTALYVAAVPGEERLVVVRQSGTVEAFADSNDAASARIVLDVRDRVVFAGEQGLLGLAFDPDFAANRYVYVHYSLAAPARSRIARFTWDISSDQMLPGSERVILEQPQPFSNHNGGMLAFGPDGYLYIAFGDGGSGGDPQNHAQNTSNWLGALLRIDVHPSHPQQAYAVPADNPFVANSAVLDEIWAYGLRNPFRFSFDRETGALWLGDVGQVSREEINIVRAGDNLGWRVYEGSLPFNNSGNTLPDSAFTFPIYEYGRDQGVSIIGGYVYRGGAIPALIGRYVYGDFGSGTVWALDYDGESVRDNAVLGSVDSPTSFGEDAAAELLVVSRSGGLFGFAEASGGATPARLSGTGLFASLEPLQAADGLIEYAVNQPAWRDGIETRQWIGLPGESQIDFAPAALWQLPVGTVLVQQLAIEQRMGDADSRRPLETRVLFREAEDWRAFSYRWQDDGQDARLVSERESLRITVQGDDGLSREQTHQFPARSDCLRCHTAVAGRTLGVSTLQLNRDFDYPLRRDNQLRAWNHIALFERDIGAASQYAAFPSALDESADLAARARAYLDVNCASCHQPNGTTPLAFDLRADTPLAESGLLDAPVAGSTLGIADARVLAPGDPQRSLLLQRMDRRDALAMPPLGTHRVDEAGVALIAAWIDSL